MEKGKKSLYEKEEGDKRWMEIGGIGRKEKENKQRSGRRDKDRDR